MHYLGSGFCCSSVHFYAHSHTCARTPLHTLTHMRTLPHMRAHTTHTYSLQHVPHTCISTGEWQKPKKLTNLNSRDNSCSSLFSNTGAKVRHMSFFYRLTRLHCTRSCPLLYRYESETSAGPKSAVMRGAQSGCLTALKFSSQVGSINLHFQKDSVSIPLPWFYSQSNKVLQVFHNCL